MFSDLQVWLNHFEYHAEHPRGVPAGVSDELKPQERRLIARSVAIFQLGEQSEGNALLRSVSRYAEKHEATPLVRIVELFVREEQRHALLLRTFMEDHAIPPKPADWTDFAFRCLRRLGGFEFRLHVFIAAELIASIFYRALETATGCQRLKILCRMLVADELAHIGLQSQLLLTVRSGKPAPIRGAIRLLHRTFFAVTAAVVYCTHRGVLQAAGFNMGSFTRACSAQYAFYLEPPTTYRASAYLR